MKESKRKNIRAFIYYIRYCKYHAIISVCIFYDGPKSMTPDDHQ
nr:MAG TPA: hypothetical protein [Caudoviricetes sp.]